MAVKTDPILGLNYAWSGDDRSGYGPQMDANLLALGAVANLAVIDRDLSTPPASPADGDRYIVGPSATDAWLGKENNVAIWRADLAAWEFYAPGSAVFYAYIADEQVISIWDSSAGQWTSGLGVSDKDSAKVARTIKPPSDADYTLTDLENAADLWQLDLSNWTVQRTLTAKDLDRVVFAENNSAVKATISSGIGSTTEVDTTGNQHILVIVQGNGVDLVSGAGGTTDSSVTVAIITPGSDGDITLTAEQNAAEIRVLETGSWAAGHSLIGDDVDREFTLINNSGFTAEQTTDGTTPTTVDAPSDGKPYFVQSREGVGVSFVSYSPGWLRGYIDGHELSNNASDSQHDVDISSGVAALTDGSDYSMFDLSSALTKQIDANWAEGSDSGGFPSGLTLASDDHYNVFIIGKDGGDVDAGFDSADDAGNLLTDAGDYSWYRRIGSVLTDGSSNIIAFTQSGDEFLLSTVVSDVDVTDPGTSAVLAAVTAPPNQRAIISGMLFNDNPSNPNSAIMTSPAQNDVAPSATLSDIKINNTGNPRQVNTKVIRLDASSRFRYRVEASSSNVTFRVMTSGWIDNRGRNE